MAGSNSHITILNFSANELNAPIKTQTGELDKKSKPIGVLYPGNPFHMHGYTPAENKGMEEDLLSKWKAKKKSGVAIL